MQVAASEMCSSLMVSVLECRSSSHGVRSGYCVAFFCKRLKAGKGWGISCNGVASHPGLVAGLLATSCWVSSDGLASLLGGVPVLLATSCWVLIT